MKMTPLKYPDKAISHAKDIHSELEHAAGYANIHRIDTERTLRMLEAAIDEMHQHGAVNEELAYIRCPGPDHLFFKSILAAGLTGKGLVDSVFDAEDYLLAQQVKFQAEQAEQDRQSRKRAMEIRAAKADKAEKQAKLDFAQRLGIDPKLLEKLWNGSEPR